MTECFNVPKKAFKVKVSWQGPEGGAVQARERASRAMVGILDPRTMKGVSSMGLRVIGSGIVRYGRRSGTR